MWDPKNAKDAFVKAAEIAHQAERTVALTLSDAFCVDRWRDEFLHLMRSRTVDLIFANEAEVRSLYQTSDFDTAVAALRRDVATAVMTRSEKGCLVISPDGDEAVPAFPVERVVDTTGAGDLFAAGFLSGLARGVDDRTCGRLGALAAGEVIQHLGARPEASLKRPGVRKWPFGLRVPTYKAAAKWRCDAAPTLLLAGKADIGRLKRVCKILPDLM